MRQCHSFFAALLIFLLGPVALAKEPIKVGVLFSLSGTMAISETVMKDVALMAIDEINKNGGVLGRPLEPILMDAAANGPLAAEKARQLLTQEKVAVVFGGSSDVVQKSMLPVIEDLNGLLVNPGRFQGAAASKNVFYAGSTLNQRAIPAADYLVSGSGGNAKRFVLIGNDDESSRATNKMLRAYLSSRGIKHSDIEESLAPRGQDDFGASVAGIKKFSQGGKTAVISTIAGDSNAPFFKEFKSQGLSPSDVPVMSLALGEDQLRKADTGAMVGHLVASSYFMSLQTPANESFKKSWALYAKEHKLAGHQDAPLIDDGMEATYVSIQMWARAVEEAKSTETSKVLSAMSKLSYQTPAGAAATVDGRMQHLDKPAFIGKAQKDGQFEVIWKSPYSIRAEPWVTTPPPPPPPDQEPAFKVVRTFFATDRRPEHKGGALILGNARSESGSLAFGFADVSVPSNRKLGDIPRPSWLRFEFRENEAKHVILRKVQLTGPKAFAAELKNAKSKRAFIFVHGYNVSFQDAALRTAQLALDLDIRCVPIFYSWPSQAGLLKYAVDWTNVEWTTPHLESFFNYVMDQTQFDEVYVIAHSMGGNAAVRALAAVLQAKGGTAKGRFKELILAAPDIDADVFKDQLMPAFQRLSTGVTLYASDNDKALKASVGVHQHKRAGLAGKQPLVAKGLETIDASFIDTDWLGHSTAFQQRALLTDITLLVANQMRAAKRPSLEVKGEKGTYWRFRP